MKTKEKLEKIRKVARYLGLCSSCFRREAREGFLTCETCGRSSSNPRKRFLRGERAKKWRAKGLCHRCGRVKIDESFATCEKCRARQKRYNQESRDRKLYALDNKLIIN